MVGNRRVWQGVNHFTCFDCFLTTSLSSFIFSFSSFSFSSSSRNILIVSSISPMVSRARSPSAFTTCSHQSLQYHVVDTFINQPPTCSLLNSFLSSLNLTRSSRRTATSWERLSSFCCSSIIFTSSPFDFSRTLFKSRASRRSCLSCLRAAMRRTCDCKSVKPRIIFW